MVDKISDTVLLKCKLFNKNNNTFQLTLPYIFLNQTDDQSKLLSETGLKGVEFYENWRSYLTSPYLPVK